MAEVEKTNDAPAQDQTHIKLGNVIENDIEKPSSNNSDTEVVEDSPEEEKKSASIKDYFVCVTVAPSRDSRLSN